MQDKRVVAGAAVVLVALVGLGVWWLRADETRSTPVEAGQVGENPGGTSPEPGTPNRGGSVARVPGVALSDGGWASAPKDPNEWVRAAWGSGPDELGRDRPSEGNPEAPMSLAVGPDGSLLVLDQINGRVQRYSKDGKLLDTFQTTQQTPQDLAVAADGTTALMDRLVDKSVSVIGPDGKLRGEFPLEGPGIEAGGGVTGLFVDGEDIYAEVEHGSLVKVGTTDGKPAAERTEIPGRPTRDGTGYLLAALISPPEGTLALTLIDKASGAQRYTRKLNAGMPLLTILFLDSDRRGTVYLALLTEEPSGQPDKDGPVSVQLVCVEQETGNVLGKVELPANTMPEETFRDFAVLDQGGVMYANRTESGVRHTWHDCR